MAAVRDAISRLNIKRLDSTMPVETITIVGDDEGGRFLRSLAEDAGIGHAQMHVTADASTQWTDAFVSRASGRRTHIFSPRRFRCADAGSF